MPDLIIVLLISIGVLAFLAFLVAYVAARVVTREAGPWVVYRVAADGSGEVEFLEGIYAMGPIWSKIRKDAHLFHWLSWAESVSNGSDILADVAPLSRFVEGKK